MALAAGDRLGPYEILGLVGSGGMGAVYRARDPRLRRDVAVRGENLVVVTQVSQRDAVTRVLNLPDGEPRLVAVHPPRESTVGPSGPSDPQGTEALVNWGQTVGLHSLDGTNRVRVLGRTRDDPWGTEFDHGHRLEARDRSAPGLEGRAHVVVSLSSRGTSVCPVPRDPQEAT